MCLVSGESTAECTPVSRYFRPCRREWGLVCQSHTGWGQRFVIKREGAQDIKQHTHHAIQETFPLKLLLQGHSFHQYKQEAQKRLLCIKTLYMKYDILLMQVLLKSLQRDHGMAVVNTFWKYPLLFFHMQKISLELVKTKTNYRIWFSFRTFSFSSLQYFPLKKTHQKWKQRTIFVCKYSRLPCLKDKQQKYVTIETPSLNRKNYK